MKNLIRRLFSEILLCCLALAGAAEAEMSLIPWSFPSPGLDAIFENPPPLFRRMSIPVLCYHRFSLTVNDATRWYAKFS